MSHYTLFGKNISFTKSEDSFLEFQFSVWEGNKKIKSEFKEWYDNCKDILTVLKGYSDKTDELISTHILNSLYNKLTELKIYDISKKTFSDYCLIIDDAYDALDEVSEVYNNIIECLEEEMEYRELRKESRGQVVGGGFGLGGAVKGMATAGAINMTTGMMHSIANSIGNASSKDEANEKLNKLYKQAYSTMCDAICSCAISTANQYMNLVNDRIPNTYTSKFDTDKATALLENSKKVPEKRIDLLVESFILCPWNYNMYEYIFESYPEERKNIFNISKNFNVDLTDTIEETLGKIYDESAHKSEELALKAKKEIISIMKELDITESTTLNNLETDCLNRICIGYQTADEHTCNTLIDKIKNYEALEKNKEPILKNIQLRIEEIWAKEDGDIFDNYILKINILSQEEVKKAIEFVKEKARTKDANKYIEMLNHCSYSNLKKARKYHKSFATSSLQIVTRFSGTIIAIVGLILWLGMDEFSFLLHILPIVCGIAIQIYINGLYNEWRILTVHGKIYHETLSISNDDFERMFIETQNSKTKTD